jgi:GT2 family glycosyltransferase
MGIERVLTVSVAYQNTEGLRQALRSLAGCCDVLVIDNGVDDTVRAAAQEFGAEYVTPGRNFGFAAAVNLGLRERNGRDVLLLNPDARVSAESLEMLVSVLRGDSKVCAVAPRLFDEDGTSQQVEWPVPSPREEWIKAFRLQRVFRPRNVFLIGAVLLMRSEAIGDVGGFDERFFLYAEECDWQLRAQRRGWKVIAVDDAVAIHAGGGSSDVEGVRRQHFDQSAQLFALKWHGRKGWMSMRAASRVGVALRLFLSLRNPARRARYAAEVKR